MRVAILAAALVCAHAGAAAAEGANAPGDPKRGEAVYGRCLACHALARDRVGPRHCGLLGRRAGSVPGFAYSAALRASGIVWTEEALDRFIANPTKTVPGTTMGYAGVKDDAERRDLIAYLRRAGETKSLCP